MDPPPANRLEPTLSRANAACVPWDTIVVGAGPAGAIAARAIALRGGRVLLVDKARFPRDKVCGGCLNYAALQLLKSVGLLDTVRDLAEFPTSRLLLASKGRQAPIALPEGLAVSRRSLDAMLVRAAIQAGAHFLDETKAELVNGRPNHFEVQLGTHVAQAAAVVIADGLSATSLRSCPQFNKKIARASRIGAGTTVVNTDQRSYPPGTIHMACASGGYVGLVRLQQDLLNVAAAFDPPFVRRIGGLAAAAREIIASAGLPEVADLDEAQWHGTAMLTVRHRPVAHQGVFLIGDSAEYVEPFTGEGMAWAIASGLSVAPLVRQAASQWRPEIDVAWAGLHHRLLHRRAIRCRILTLLLRHDWLTSPAIAVLARFPALARPLTHEVAAPFALPQARS